VNRETSWGEFYERFTGALGFKPHSDEGKVMGLAAYGDPEGKVFPFVHMSNGTEMPHFEREGFLKALKEIRPRASTESPINGYHEHIAARLQYSLEQAIGRMSEILHGRSGFTDLCMAGGTALNCSSNGKLLRLPHVKRIFVQPAAADCGTALGAAVYAHVKLTGTRPKTRFNHMYWGPGFSNEEIEPVLKQAKVPYRKVENIGQEAAKLIRDNKIVGWFQGRMEVGPRALGGRSIVANPMDPRMKDAVNKHVKFREPWRPFAPSILADHMEEYFGTKHPSPFMILAFPARAEVKSKIPAALHVDGTGRPQTVEKETNPRYWELIDEFRKLTGVPVVLNTSFNVAGQPIVCTPKDAVATFYICGLDALAIGDFIVEKGTTSI
jgi:carbamoyltransferase